MFYRDAIVTSSHCLYLADKPIILYDEECEIVASGVQSVTNITVTTKTEHSSEIMPSAREEPEERDHGVHGLQTVSGDARKLRKDDYIQDSAGLAVGQSLGSYLGISPIIE